MKTTQRLERTKYPCLFRARFETEPGVYEYGTYYALFKVNGRQVKRSLNTTNLAKARSELELVRQREGKVKPGSDVALAVMADMWLKSVTAGLKESTRTRLEATLKVVTAAFECGVKSITRTDIEAWKARREKRVAPRTLNKELDALRSVLGFAVDRRLVLENAAAGVGKLRVSKPLIHIPSKSEFAAVLGELGKSAQAAEAQRLVKFLAYSGCRLGEALGVVWGDVDVERGTFTVTGGEGGTKNRRERVVPLFAPLRELVESMKPETPDSSARLFNIRSAKTAIKAACRRAKVAPFGHHALRHLFVSTCVEQGIDFRTIAGWVGHSDGGVLLLKTYAHLRDEHSREMAQRLTASAYTVADKATTSAEPVGFGGSGGAASASGNVTVTGFASGASFTFA